jgi:SAM-dependent methyltransferase
MQDESITAATQRFYDTMARRNPALAFMNYGFADPASGLDGEMDPAGLAAASRALYDAVLGRLSGAERLLEVGCGRGGGAAFVLESRTVGQYLGLDISTENVRRCRERLGATRRAHFAVADARRLPVPAEWCDAAFSVEAAQHFESREQFYRDVARALRPAGRFFLASIWRPAEVESADTFAALGLRVVDAVDITANVVASLERSCTLRRQIVESLQLPDTFTPLLMSWAGVRGCTAFDALASRALVYLRFELARTSCPV